MAIKSPEDSDLRLEQGSLGSALRRRLPRIVLVTALLLAATYLVLPFVPLGGGSTMPASGTETSPGPAAAASVNADPHLAELQQRVTDADSKIADFKIANDLYTTASGGSLLDQQVSEASNQIAAATARRDAATAHATLIRGLLDAKQPIDSVQDIRNSVTIQQLEQQKGQLVAQRAQLLATFLPGHPGIVTATAQIASIDKQIVAEAKRVADALDAEAAIEANGLATLQQNLSDLKSRQAAEARSAVTLDALQRDAAAARDLLQGYLGRYGASADGAQSSSANAAAPVAAPARATARNTVLILAAVGLLALAVQIGAVFLLNLFPPGARDRSTADDGVADEPYRHEDASDVVAAESPAASDAATLGEATAAATMVNPAQSLRRWFTRHARPAGAEAEADAPLSDEAADAEAPEPQLDAALADSHPAESLPPEAPEQRDAVATGARSLDNLAADLILGRASVVVLASLGEVHESEMLAERLASDALDHGLSVAHVDAASGRPSSEPGITDLAAGRVGFGDVVFKVQEGLAEIPWGHLEVLDHDSSRPVTLVEALAEVYEVVLVAAGAIGADNSLALFADLDARLVLVGTASPARLEACRNEAARLGFRQVEVLAPPNWRAAVA